MKGNLGRGSLSAPCFFCRLAFVVMLLGTCLLPGWSNVCWAEETEPSTPANANDTGKSISAQALELAKSGREEEARTFLRTAYDSAGGKTDPEIPYFLAALEARNDDLKAAIRHLKEAKDMFEESKSSDQYQNLLLLKRLGDCRYRDNDGETALVDYKSALLLSELLRREPSVVREEILESLVACLLNAKDYGEAEKYGLMLQASAQTRLEKDQRAVLSVVWSQLQLADVYRLSNQREKLLALRKELRPLLESLVELRMSKEQTGELLPYDALVQAFRQNYIAELDPRTPAEIGWAACDFRERTLPIIGWGDSRDATAAIVCVHGLGLENRAFKNTAEALNKRGYVVYALDVRGFGSWTMTKG
ncbi:MAG: lysophospholipase, partial [Cyanobacteria bacterium]|nr:lysophospholipase [Cyanobacteriota bacterium]